MSEEKQLIFLPVSGRSLLIKFFKIFVQTRKIIACFILNEVLYSYSKENQIVYIFFPRFLSYGFEKASFL